MKSMTLSTKDAAVLALLSRDVPMEMKKALILRLSGDAKKIAENLAGRERGSARVQAAADELRKWKSALEGLKRQFKNF